MKKIIYLVRHGESEANVGEFHGQPTTPLTVQGEKQAQFIGQRCKALMLQALITSTYTRARQTAECISRETGLIPEESDLFVENAFVSTLWGTPRTEPAAQKALTAILDNWGIPGYRFADEENFEDVVHRAGMALQFLSERPEERIGVVTHGGFLRNIVGRAMFGELFDPQISGVFFTALHIMENTGLTVLTFNEENTAHPWRLKIWNDHAHLAD